MTLNNETPKRFDQTTDDQIINKRHNTKITYLLVLMQLHLNPSLKGNQLDIFVTQCFSDIMRYIRFVLHL